MLKQVPPASHWSTQRPPIQVHLSVTHPVQVSRLLQTTVDLTCAAGSGNVSLPAAPASIGVQERFWGQGNVPLANVPFPGWWYWLLLRICCPFVLLFFLSLFLGGVDLPPAGAVSGRDLCCPLMLALGDGAGVEGVLLGCDLGACFACCLLAFPNCRPRTRMRSSLVGKDSTKDAQAIKTMT